MKEENMAYIQIKEILGNARENSYTFVNSIMVQAYWNIGRIIVEEEQAGEKRAKYGINLIVDLSFKLTNEFGKGFNERNLRNMRDFYLFFPKWNAVRSELTWTHYRILLKVKEESQRNYYLSECISSNWSTREFERQINSLLYERVTISKDKNKIRNIEKEEKLSFKDMIKDPYVLDFLNLKENKDFLEKDLENEIINKIQKFMLELGRGFSFIERQKRIIIEDEHFYIDLIFYNYILKCFVLVDLKVGKLKHQDIGQLDFYVRYFEDKIKSIDDNPTIGIILCTEKSNAIVKYSVLNDNNNLFVSKYKLYLPTQKEFENNLNN